MAFLAARSPAIDAMIAAVVAAKTHEEFDDAVRAYDRDAQAAQKARVSARRAGD